MKPKIETKALKPRNRTSWRTPGRKLEDNSSTNQKARLPLMLFCLSSSKGTLGLSMQPVFFFPCPIVSSKVFWFLWLGNDEVVVFGWTKKCESEHTRPYSPNPFAFYEFQSSQSQDSWIGSKDIFGFASPSPPSARRLLENSGRHEEMGPFRAVGASANLELAAIRPIQVPVSLLKSSFLDLAASSYLWTLRSSPADQWCSLMPPLRRTTLAG